jgi:hypothetical protein
MGSDTTRHVGEKLYWVIISARNTNSGQSKLLRWVDLPWEVRSKWDWYFRYRAALVQVQHPRWHIDFSWGSEDATGVQLARHRQNVLRAKRPR